MVLKRSGMIENRLPSISTGAKKSGNDKIITVKLHTYKETERFYSLSIFTQNDLDWFD